MIEQINGQNYNYGCVLYDDGERSTENHEKRCKTIGTNVLHLASISQRNVNVVNWAPLKELWTIYLHATVICVIPHSNAVQFSPTFTTP